MVIIYTIALLAILSFMGWFVYDKHSTRELEKSDMALELQAYKDKIQELNLKIDTCEKKKDCPEVVVKKKVRVKKRRYRKHKAIKPKVNKKILEMHDKIMNMKKDEIKIENKIIINNGWSDTFPLSIPDEEHWFIPLPKAPYGYFYKRSSRSK